MKLTLKSVNQYLMRFKSKNHWQQANDIEGKTIHKTKFTIYFGISPSFPFQKHLLRWSGWFMPCVSDFIIEQQKDGSDKV